MLGEAGRQLFIQSRESRRGYSRSDETKNHLGGVVAPPAGTQAGATHWNPGLQSLFVWQGHAQRPTCVLQRCERQVASA
jgi:hypothetical protein